MWHNLVNFLTLYLALTRYFNTVQYTLSCQAWCLTLAGWKCKDRTQEVHGLVWFLPRPWRPFPSKHPLEKHPPKGLQEMPISDVLQISCWKRSWCEVTGWRSMVWRTFLLIGLQAQMARSSFQGTAFWTTSMAAGFYDTVFTSRRRSQVAWLSFNWVALHGIGHYLA